MDVKIDMDAFYAHMQEGRTVEPDSAIMYAFHIFSQEALKITTELTICIVFLRRLLRFFQNLQGKK